MAADIPAVRLERLSALVRENGIVSLKEAQAELGVSEVTLRRDFAALGRMGVVQRTRGGIIAKGRVANDVSYDGRQTREHDAKQMIGNHAASLIEEGDTIFLSGGTTCLALARALSVKHGLTVITNCIDALTVLMSNSGIRLISTGGVASAHNHDLTGADAEGRIAQYRVAKAFVGASGITPDGVFNASLPRAATDRLMAECALTRFILADHTKVGVTALSLVAPLERFQCLVTDIAPHADHLEWLESADVEVRAPAEEGS